MKLTIQPPSVVIATNFLPMASPHQLALTSAGRTRLFSLNISLTKVAIVFTSGVSRVAVLLSGVAKAPPLEVTNGEKRAQSAPMQKPPNLPLAAMALAAVRISFQVHWAVGSAIPASVNASGRYTRPRVPQSLGLSLIHI